MKRILAILSTTLFVASQSAYPATDIQLSISSVADLPVEVEVEWSPDLTGVIDLIATSNLNSNDWELVFIDSIPAGITNLYWVDESPSSARFFTAGNGQFDSDGDLLSNAQEFLDYLTDPRDPDTDNDGLEDGDETHGDGSFGDTDGFITNPFLPDRANYNLPEFTASGPTDDLLLRHEIIVMRHSGCAGLRSSL